MKFFIIVSFIMTSLSVDRPMYVFSKPTFDSMNDCKAYVSVKHMEIYRAASASYNFKLKPEAVKVYSAQYLSVGCINVQRSQKFYFKNIFNCQIPSLIGFNV